jgi:HK97 family phage major capsid protein
MATRLNTLRAEQQELRAKATAILAKAEAEGCRKLSASEAKEVDDLTAALDRLRPEVERELRLSEADRAAATLPPAAGLVRPARGRRFAEMFPSVPLDMAGFKSADEYLTVLASGLGDPRLLASNSISVPSEGGLSAPSQLFATWLDTSLESELVRPRATVIPMTTSEAWATGWDSNDHTSVTYGGFSAEWIAEGADLTVQTPKLRAIKLRARKLALLAAASNELVADGQGFEQQLSAAIPKAIGFSLDRAFLVGSGAAGPQPILTAPCTVTVTKEVGQAGGSIVFANLAKMFARLHPESFPNAVWACSSTTIPYLLQLSIPIGTGGSHVPVLTESGGKFRMLTLPCVFSEKLPTLGTVGDIGLYDFTQYVVGLRADFSLAKSQHIFFQSDKTAYRGLLRVDGQPKLQTVITPENGDTLSPFVLLETRS